MKNKDRENIIFAFKYNKSKYFVVTTLFLLSTSVYFSAHVEYLTLAFMLFGGMFISTGKKLSKDFIIIFLALTVLNLANVIIFKFFPFRTVAGNYIRFLMPFFVIMLVGQYFPHYFVHVVKFFTIISFIFYIPANLIPGFNDLLQNIPKLLGTDPLENNHFIIYQVEYGKPWNTNIPIFRNSGPTGEPGEFAGYLMLAIIFEMIIKRKLWTKNNIIFTIALLTTFSTTGYIAFFILLSAYYLLFSSIKSKIILFPLSVILAFNIYFKYEFMYEKVDLQAQTVISAKSINDIPREGRLPNLIRNFRDSFDKPIFGKGRNFKTRYSNYEMMEAKEFSNNVASFPVQFGWPFFLFYSFLIVKGFKIFLYRNKLNTKYAYVLLFTIYTLAIGQGFLLTSVFILLLYFRSLYIGKREYK